MLVLKKAFITCGGFSLETLHDLYNFFKVNKGKFPVSWFEFTF